jgi:RHS repeat-associated protein
VIIPAVDIVYHYDADGRLIAETTQNGTKIRNYYYVAGQLVAVDGCVLNFGTGCNDREWYHSDVLGNVVARTNSAKVITARVSYQPWGETPTQGTGAEGARLYNGKLYDDLTNFYDYGARVYSPQLGRFLSPDAVWALPVNPQSSNLYSYTLNNPLKYTDPNGKAPVTAVLNLLTPNLLSDGGMAGAGAALPATLEENGRTVFLPIETLDPASAHYDRTAAIKEIGHLGDSELKQEGPQWRASEPETERTPIMDAMELVEARTTGANQNDLLRALRILLAVETEIRYRGSSEEFISSSITTNTGIRRVRIPRTNQEKGQVDSRSNQRLSPRKR